MTTIEIPPAARAGIHRAAVAGQRRYPAPNRRLANTGPIGDPMKSWKLAAVNVSSANASKEPPRMPPAVKQTRVERFAGVAGKKPNVQRNLYFSEINVGSNGPGQFFITVQGQLPKVFDAMDPPAIKTKIGNVEDWTIENHAGEVHVFHIHQLPLPK